MKPKEPGVSVEIPPELWVRLETLRHVHPRKLTSSRAWRRYRKLILEVEPLCRDCANASPPRWNPATEIHHIIPRAEGGDVIDPAGLMPLCFGCHAIRTRMQNRGAPPYATDFSGRIPDVGKAEH